MGSTGWIFAGLESSHERASSLGPVEQPDPIHRSNADGSRRSLELSARELEVLAWLPTHLSNAEIGRQVHMSVNTVKSHLKEIYLALGARSRSEAVATAERLGLLDTHCARCAWRDGTRHDGSPLRSAVRRRVS